PTGNTLPQARRGHPASLGPWSPAPLSRMTPLEEITAFRRLAAFIKLSCGDLRFCGVNTNTLNTTSSTTFNAFPQKNSSVRPCTHLTNHSKNRPPINPFIAVKYFL
ncbi:hypothetical protein, partial [Burkholderia sp. ABCPW 14]|uniref:hypothetical protein n=1 Tax=Burkholderia sp. ABCPW 14 TaxID=1637860 RepID=UPI001E64261F